jgi:hypothetical protein
MTLLNNQEQQQYHQYNQHHIPIDKNKRPLIHYINKAINSSRRQSDTDQPHLRRPVSNKCLLRYSYQEEKPLTYREPSNNYLSHSLQRKCNQTRRPLAITNTFYYCPNTINENEENGDDNLMKLNNTNRRLMSGNDNFLYDYMNGASGVEVKREEEFSKKSLSSDNNKSAFQTIIKPNSNERNEYFSSKFLFNSN